MYIVNVPLHYFYVVHYLYIINKINNNFINFLTIHFVFFYSQDFRYSDALQSLDAQILFCRCSIRLLHLVAYLPTTLRPIIFTNIQILLCCSNI